MNEEQKLPTTVSLSGDSVKTIREEKSLTQLYIAEVVGVSVDTVSRWENNRTAAVKRDNAVALAEALEVDVALILKDDEPLTPSDEDPSQNGEPQPRQKSALLAYPVKTALCIIAALIIWSMIPASSKNSDTGAVRLLPPYTPPGSEVPVVVDLAVGGDTPLRLVLRETLPPGWVLVGAVPTPDQGPDEDGVVKWLLTLDGTSARVVYLVKTPQDAAESTAHYFDGEVVTSGRGTKGVAIAGEGRIDLEYLHWADDDADFTIDDSEVLRALERLESARELGLETGDIRSLWGVGEYTWNPLLKKFTPKTR